MEYCVFCNKNIARKNAGVKFDEIIHKRLLAAHGNIGGHTVTFRENNSKQMHHACQRTLQSRATTELDEKHRQARLKHNHDMPEPTRKRKCTINF